MVFATSVGPVELPQLRIEPRQTSASAIEARLINPSTYALVVTSASRVIVSNRPLEIQIAHEGSHSDESTAAYLAQSISAHARLELVVEAKSRPSVMFTVETSVRPTEGGWIARAQLYPASWADAASIRVTSLTIADRPVACSFFPASVRVGFNHASAAAGAVLTAAKAGDVTALKAVLEAGGSTEEADKVCEERGCDPIGIDGTPSAHSGYSAPALLQDGWTPLWWASSNGHFEALRVLLCAGANPATRKQVSTGRGRPESYLVYQPAFGNRY